ncbi:MAG: DUF481 domain-containing protein [Acidobacteria bacterium]|nr:DUF481 domain-containing protein [Acidobacteriota bacterium]
MRRLSFIATLTLICTAPVHADEVRLANGDRLTGTAVTLAGGTLTFATPYGDVRLPWAQVTRLVVTDPILVTVGTALPTATTLLDAGADGRATLQPGGVIPLGDIVALARPQPALVIDGGAGAGLTTTEGNTEVNNLRLDGDVVARAGENRYSGNAAVTRARGSGVETARNWTIGLKYDRFVSPRLFVNANTILIADAGISILTGPAEARLKPDTTYGLP